MSNIIVSCPHCKEYILIEQLNCGIFRHGTFKHDGKQIDAHSNKNVCDYYVENNMIYGCGKPFQLFLENNIIKIVICDYI
jgi:hypothetical protein